MWNCPGGHPKFSKDRKHQWALTRCNPTNNSNFITFLKLEVDFLKDRLRATIPGDTYILEFKTTLFDLDRRLHIDALFKWLSDRFIDPIQEHLDGVERLNRQIGEVNAEVEDVAEHGQRAEHFTQLECVAFDQQEKECWQNDTGIEVDCRTDILDVAVLTVSAKFLSALMLDFDVENLFEAPDLDLADSLKHIGQVLDSLIWELEWFHLQLGKHFIGANLKKQEATHSKVADDDNWAEHGV